MRISNVCRPLLYTNICRPFPGIFGCSNAEKITDAPARVAGVIPVDTATHVQLDQIITWGRSAMAQWYDVYFGTDNPPLTKVSDNQTARAYVPVLALDTTYYVRVNAANSLGETPGDVTSFTTWAEADILTDENGVPLTDETGAYLEDS
jgi:hypothetical protein